MSILYSWMMWKLPLSFFSLDLALQQPENRKSSIGIWGGGLGVLLAADILLSVFTPFFYWQYMFFGFNLLVALIVAGVANRPNIGRGLGAAFFPLFYIAVLYACYTIAWPSLYKVYTGNFGNWAAYVQVYLFLLWDLLTYSLLLLLNNYLPQMGKAFASTIHYLILGYFVGINLLVGVTEVEFYYLAFYLVFRNFFTHWVMRRWEGVTNVPPCLWAWPLPYYLSYAFNFLPIIELGNFIVSKSFYSQEFSQACMILSFYPTSEYPYNSTTPAMSYNPKLRGFVFWVGAAVVWALSTFSQKYPRRKPTPLDLAYNVFGIYLFYVGISAGLELPILSQVVWWWW